MTHQNGKLHIAGQEPPKADTGAEALAPGLIRVRGSKGALILNCDCVCAVSPELNAAGIITNTGGMLAIPGVSAEAVGAAMADAMNRKPKDPDVHAMVAAYAAAVEALTSTKNPYAKP